MVILMLLNISEWLKGYRPTKNSTQAIHNPHFNKLDGIAIVNTAIHPKERGRVHFQASFWPAVCESNVTFTPGERVRVIGRINITLIVDSLP